MDQDEFSAALKAAVEKEEKPQVEGLEEKLERLATEEEQEELETPSEDEPEEEQVEDEPEESEQGSPPDPPQSEDPLVAEYLARFGGDAEKAIKAAAHQTSVIGRQGAELGELRAAIEQMQQQVYAPQPQQFLGDVEEQIVENPSQMAAWALQNQQEQIFEASMAEWYEQDPRSAARFERTIEQEILKSELAQTLQPAQAQQMQVAMVQAKRELVAEFPDAEQILESVTDDELKGLDPSMVGQLRNQNPRAALEVVYRWVKSGRAAGETQQTSVTRAQNAQVKKDAAVVKSTSSTPAREEKTPMEQLKERMLAPAEYSVSHGLQQ